jgi:two-component system, NtrC family, sensor kinase
MLIHRFLPLVALALNLLLLGSALAPDRRSHRDRVFAWLAAGLAVWNLGVFGLRSTATPAAAFGWEWFLHFGVIPIPVLFFHYVLAFLDAPRGRAALVTGYALTALFLGVSPSWLFISGVRDTPWGFAPVTGLAYALFVIHFQCYLVAGLVLLVRAYRRTTSSFKRNRTILVIFGAVVSLLGGAMDFLRFLLDWESLYPFGIPANAVFGLALGIAIVRYQLMDVGALVKRMVLYLLTSVALAPILFVGLWALDQLAFARPAGLNAPADTGLLVRDALILLLVFTVALPLIRQLEGGLARLMFRRRHGVRDALIALSRELAAQLDARALGTTLTGGLVAKVPVSHASLHVHDRLADAWPALASAASDDSATPEIVPAPAVVAWLRMTGRPLAVEGAGVMGMALALETALAELERARVALLVPVLLEGEPAAIIVVGEKLSGEVFDPEELELLEALAGEAAIALRNARLYGELGAQLDELQRTQAQLVQSAKLAAIGELAASVAHEINNPLTVVSGLSQLMQQTVPPDSHEAQRLSTILGETQRAGRIVRDLLDFSRRREPRRERIRLHDAIQRALDLLDVRLKRRVEIQRLFDAELPDTMGDRDQLTQVFLNLVGNAADAMPQGGTLTVHTKVQEAEGGGAAIVASVSDTGGGIRPEVLDHIFEPFFTTKPEGQGTGLGLSVSLGIVHAHGGTIDVESQLGLGTTFRVVLPTAAG